VQAGFPLFCIVQKRKRFCILTHLFPQSSNLSHPPKRFEKIPVNPHRLDAARLSDGQGFPLWTAVADQHHGHFSGLLIHLRHQPQVIRPAFEAGHVKLAEGTASGRLARLIIFPAHEISRGIHATKLSHALDNACPSENYSFGFSYCPGSRRVHFLPAGMRPNHAFAASGRTSSR